MTTLFRHDDMSKPLLLESPIFPVPPGRDAVDHTQIRFSAPGGGLRARVLDDDIMGVEMTSLMRGTLIETELGPRPIQELEVGDNILTKDDGMQPLRWIAQRQIGAAELHSRPDLRPIRIRAGGLGPLTPTRDLLVSAGCRTLLSDWRCHMLFGEEEMLAPLDALLNDQSIMRDHDASDVTYFHLMLDRHQIIRAEGVEVETYHPGYIAHTTLAPDALDKIARRVPQLDGDLSRFGMVARPRLKGYEALVLLAQQSV